MQAALPVGSHCSPMEVGGVIKNGLLSLSTDETRENPEIEEDQ